MDPNPEETEMIEIPKGDFPIVGLGASAGGLEAFGAFFSNMPPDTGMAFVLVQHLDPGHASSMVELLKKYTRMPVIEATNNVRIEPNRVYMIPPNKGMVISDKNLMLIEQTTHPGIAHSIDTFFRSLADERKENAIGIVLSGTGSDGTLGAKAIKAGLGLVIVQEPKSARYDGMPQAAIAAGVADIVLPVEEMAGKLIEYVKTSYGKLAEKRHLAVETSTDAMQRIFAIVRARTRHDFSGYKPSTLNRRIERRMKVNQFENVEDYIRLLSESPREVETLFKDFLINVTSFFRDPEAFNALAEKLKVLMEHRYAEGGRAFRAWVVGCSTGEEAYSLAILLHETMDELKKYFDWQIFGTDLDGEAIETARHGVYPENIRSDVSPERLTKFFTAKENQFAVNREIRERLIFSVHDVAGDPPFSRIDLISARNLLIYLNIATQQRLLPLFHYALNRGGILFLGTAETVGEFGDYFVPLDRKWRIYETQKRAVSLPVTIAPTVPPLTARMPVSPVSESYTNVVIHEAEKDLLKALPPSILIDESGRVLYVHGDTWKYLQLAEGRLSDSVLDMAREGIKPTLGNTINEALAKGEAVTRTGATSRINGNVRKVRITVKPVRMTARGSQKLAVIFEDVTEPAKRGKKGQAVEDKGRFMELEQELQFTRENLRSTVEELETANEELRSANEEYQSTNEELQSTNEELETSREELQSVNEELVTINTEHQKKIEELSTINDDMQNLLNSTDIATIFLDHRLNIKRYTPAATHLLNLIDADIGRPLSHITSTLKIDRLNAAAHAVLNKLVPVVQDVETQDGRWYSLRVHPYRTTENLIAGAVMSFVDINEQKQLQEEQRKIIDTLRESVLVLDTNLKIASANEAFYHMFQMTAAQAEGKHVSEISKSLDIRQLHELVRGGGDADARIEGIKVECDIPGTGRRTLSLTARLLHMAAAPSQKVLLVMEEIGKNK